MDNPVAEHIIKELASVQPIESEAWLGLWNALEKSPIIMSCDAYVPKSQLQKED